jgi:hypothetical protein
MDELERLVRTAQAAVNGDSNDAEIEALWDALSEALRQLGRSDLEAER